MRTPKTYTSAKNAGYIVSNTKTYWSNFNSENMIEVHMKERYFKQGSKMLHFTLTQKGAKRLGINF